MLVINLTEFYLHVYFLKIYRYNACFVMAGWQSGHAAACKAADAGPIPAPASQLP